MLKVENLSKSFGDVKALDNVSFEVKSGEVVGLLGPNGAGKTTCMRVITGFYFQDSGKVTIDGKDYSKHSNEIKSSLGYLPENNPLYKNLTVKEYLEYVSKLKGVNNIKDRIDNVVARVGLKEVFRKKIASLSKGYKQRVGLAQALLNSPKLLVLDEPTEGLDPNQREEIRSLISKLGRDKTVILSSHVLGEVQKVCNRVIIIDKGKLVHDSKVADLDLGESVTISAKIKGKGVLTGLRTIKGVKNVEKKGDDLFIITSLKDKDIRPDIVRLSGKKGWDVYEMYQKKVSLEDVFKKITS